MKSINKVTSLSTLLVVGVLLIWGAATQKAFAEEAYITKPSKYSVLTTIDRLERIVKKKGLTVFTRIDHQAGAEKAGLTLGPSQVLIFGNPKIGTPLINENPVMGVILPLRVLSYQGPNGKTWLTYIKPEVMLKNSALAKEKGMSEKITKALDNLTRFASGH